MGFYPERIERHFEFMTSPGSRGQACATAASFECGCYVRIGLEIDAETGMVAGVGARSNGCGFMVAAAAALAEMIRGKHLAELHGLRSPELLNDLQSQLGTFPPERLQCARVPVDALRSAFAEYRATRITEFAGERALICTCFGIGEDTIEKALIDPSVATVEDIGSLTRAGTGCGSCQMLIQEMLDGREGP